MKRHTFFLLAILCAARTSFAQEDFLNMPKGEVMKYISANNMNCRVKAFRDSVYPDIKEKITVTKFNRWNTEGTLELYVSKKKIIKYFEINFRPKEWKTTSYDKNLKLALDEITKKYGEVFFTHLAHGVSSYAWDTKDGEYNFLIFTKKHTWSFGFYPDTGD
jgi:hypothetical protein